MAGFIDASGRRLLHELAACLFLVSCWIGTAAAQKGQFSGDLVLKVLSDGRTMELVQPFTYTDSGGVLWPVPAHTKVDGASIPSVFWSIVGAPYTGKYREASVIHDHYCATRSRHWKAVHRVFLDGMLARGVDRTQAQLMYLAVYRFGPRWDFDVDACFCRGCPTCANPILKRISMYTSEYKDAEFQELRNKLTSGRYTLEQLEDAADYQLNTDILKSR
ncbi:DUF1353 domain-containing protein (plasmid) [Bradyrhizobium barranii subsp. barranii]|uniref:DUF1353 domain-containing protein n=1 Tax=Bradyrhizobium barranii subsp. barranii TaxID=2823807 RepID=A0A7Z0QLZ2_9BRAD|nr:DUF1353 domain-containing protein [Bradyrhizobium barranii]UGX89797.1 DUF1353 domain-containing protein [Bradyrhizobium barranii subsp. barranii]